MAREYVFDDFDSIIHSIYGFTLPFVALKWWFVAIILFWVFVLYEVAEPENPVATLGDLTEFGLGVLSALIIFIPLHFV